MTTVVGALEIQLLADVARLQRDMDGMKRTVDSGMRDIQRMAQGAANALGALGAGLSIAAFVGFTRGVVEANAALDDMAEITGASVESLSALRQVARVSGQEFGAVGDAIVKLNKNLAGVDDEGKGAGKALAAIGLGLDDIRQMKGDEQMLAIAKAMNEYEDSGSKAAVAQALLGKSGATLLPYLKDLAKWGQLNASVTAEQAAESEALQKNMARLQSDLTDVGAALVGEMLPYMQLVTTEFRNAQQGADDFGASGGALKTIAETLIVLFSEVSFVFEGVGTEIGGIAAQIAMVAQGEFAKAAEIGRMMKADAAVARAEHDKFIASVMTLDKQLASPAVPEATKKHLAFSSAVGKTAKATKEVADSTTAWHAAIMQAFNDVVAWEESGKELEKIALDEAKAWNSLTESVEAHANALEAEVANYGKTEAEIQRSIVARYEEARSRVVVNEESAKLIAYLEHEIDARKRIIAASGDKAVLDANKEATKRASDDWQKVADDVNRSLTDAIMSGGKTGGELLQDYFKTLVLRPLIQGAMAPVTNAVGSFFGGGSGGGSGLGGLPIPGGGSLYSAFAGSSLGQSLGLATTEFVTASGTGTALTAAGSTLGAALPYIGAAIAVGSLLMEDEGPAQRRGNFRSGLGLSTGVGPGESNNAIDQTEWFSGVEMNASLNEFQISVAAREKAIVAALGLTSQQQQAANSALYALGDRRYNFGTEQTDWRQSGAAEAIVADRMQAISSAIGISLEEINAALNTPIASLRSAYKNLYSSDADKLAAQTAALAAEFTKLKIEMPATRAEFVGLVDASTGKLERGLLKLAPAFDLVAKAAEAEAAAATERAAGLARQSRALDIELMQALGDTAAATAATRDDALAALDESLRAKQREIWAAQDAAAAISAAQASAAAEHQALIARYDQERAALRSIASQMDGFGNSLAAFRASLGMPGETGGVGYGQARSQFAATGLAAISGDDTALGALPTTISTFLAASKTQARTRLDFARDQAAAYAVIDASIATTSGISAAANRRAGPSDATAVEISALRADLRAANLAIAANTAETAKLLRRWNGDGMPETRVVA